MIPEEAMKFICSNLSFKRWMKVVPIINTINERNADCSRNSRIGNLYLTFDCHSNAPITSALNTTIDTNTHSGSYLHFNIK